MSAPIPLAAISRPKPTSPASNTRLGEHGDQRQDACGHPEAELHGDERQHPVILAGVACGLDRGGRGSRCGRRPRPSARTAARRTRNSSPAESANDTASATKAVSAPKTVETTPPSDAPTASMMPHSEPASAFAVARSSGSTAFGVAAENAGSNAAANKDRIARARRPATGSPVPPRGTRGRSRREPGRTTIMSRRRSSRSASQPAHGVAKKIGSTWDTMRRPTEVAVPVTSKTNPPSATKRNQSPPSEITDATNRRRKSGFRRSNDQAARAPTSRSVPSICTRVPD